MFLFNARLISFMIAFTISVASFSSDTPETHKIIKANCDDGFKKMEFVHNTSSLRTTVNVKYPLASDNYSLEGFAIRGSGNFAISTSVSLISGVSEWGFYYDTVTEKAKRAWICRPDAENKYRCQFLECK